MKFTMTQIAAAVVLSATAMSAQAVTLTFANSAGGSYTSGVFASGTGASAFTAGNEFRMISGTNTIGGGGQKSTMSGDEVWSFDNTSTKWTGVAGGALVGGAASSTHCALGGCAGIDDGAVFFGPVFGFLASLDGNTIGLTPATMNFGSLAGGIDAGDTFSILMPLLEAHWGDSRFPMAAVTFNGVVTDAAGHFLLTAEHTITAAEDPDSAGFADFTAQWRYEGVVSAAPVPEASTYGMMLAGLGLVGFAVRRRNQQA